MAGKQVQRRKGTTAETAVFTGALAECTVDTTKKTVVVHDGAQPGGFPLARESALATTNANVTTAQNAANAAQASANTGIANAATAQTQANLGVSKANTAQAEVDALEVVVATNATLAVPRDTTTGAATIPTGNNAQRPVAPVEGQFRFNSQLTRFEGYQNGQWAQVGGDSLPVFFTTWWPNRAAVPPGFVVADGQLLSRATFPDAATAILAGNVPTVSDATWLSTVLQRGNYTLGDGSTNFRMPDYNGKYTGSLGAVFQRGDGAQSAGTNGLLQASANLSHSHGYSLASPAASAGVAGGGQAYFDNNNGTGTTGASGGTESRPLNVTGCWVVKLFGAVINPGSVNAAQLASDLANLTATSYSRATILGTVSQTAGVPTGALMQYGSNANGEFWKHASGLLICKRRVTTTKALNAVLGALFYAAGGVIEAAQDMPATFIAAPGVGVVASTTSAFTGWTAGLGAGTTSQWGGCYILEAFSRVSQTYSLDYIAIGRWF